MLFFGERNSACAENMVNSRDLQFCLNECTYRIPSFDAGVGQQNVSKVILNR